MVIVQTKEKILKLASDLDDDLEKMEIEALIPYFAEDCEIELLGLSLKGISGLKKWLKWFFESLLTKYEFKYK